MSPHGSRVCLYTAVWDRHQQRVLAENEATRFNAIARAIPDISPKVLSESLKGLEKDSLIHRHIYAEVPPRVEYSLTSLGKSLIPHLNALITWSLENYDTIIGKRSE